MPAVYLRSLLFTLALCAITSKSAGQLVITGHEERLIIGLPRDIQCLWTGDSNATLMEWFVVGLEAVAVESATDTRELVLTLDPDTDGLDGAMFTCRATLSDGRQVEKSITLVVREIINTVNITSSEPNATAGQQFTLTCTVTSERPPEVTWIDPDGVPCPLDGPDVAVSQTTTIGQTSIVEMRFRSIRTSQSGRYKCISNIAYPLSKSEDSFLVQVQIPEPTVSILRDPEGPDQLFTTDSLVLTCVIELIPEVDSFVTISSQWRGHSSLTDSERRVIVSDLEGVQLVYNTSVTFSTLKSSDSGSYVCSATVSPDVSDSLIESAVGVSTIIISVVLKVTIDVTYNPPFDFTLPSPPYYHPTSSVTLTCRAHHASGSVSYRWSSTCNSCFASSSTAQTISETILNSNSAGVHTCRATDGGGNTGSNSTEMKLIGAGIYVSSSYHVNQLAVSNNSLIVKKPNSCYYCKIDVYCYSNSTSSSVGYYKSPNNQRIYSNRDYYDYKVERINPSGIRIRSYRHDTPDIWGIFTCELPDSEGNTVDTSIGIYSSMPSAPSVYSSRYSDLSNTYGNVLGSLECLTQYSPPTNVTWLRDGEPVHVDGERYEMIQSVIERQSYSRYNNTLLIRDAAGLAGDHIYTCTITNNAGSISQNINTRLEAHPVVDIYVPEAIYSEPFNMTCRATLNPKVASQLIQYMVVEWISVDGQSMSQDGVTIEQQQTYSDTATRSLIFDRLKMAHGGDYKCVANVTLPDSAGSFNTSAEYHLNVLNRTLIQLKFGPVVHCSKWYEDKRMAQHLEGDIKETLTSIINKNCSCGFQTSQIDEGEFSCRTLQDMVMYRARLTGSSDTLTPPEFLAILQEWVTNDGTFLYTYHGRMRLGLDQHCPLEITSFSQPECNGVKAA